MHGKDYILRKICKGGAFPTTNFAELRRAVLQVMLNLEQRDIKPVISFIFNRHVLDSALFRDVNLHGYNATNNITE